MMAGVNHIDRSICMDADTVWFAQVAFGIVDANAQNTGQCTLIWVVLTNALVLIVCDNDVISQVDGNVLGRI